jgi:hypothetical protein
VRRDVDRHRARIAGAELVAHHAGVDAAGSADLGDGLEEVHVAIDQERDARREGVDLHAALDQAAHDVADLDHAERDLRDGVEPALADGVGVLEEGVELRQLAGAEQDRVERHAQPQGMRPVQRIAGAALGVERELHQRAAYRGERHAGAASRVDEAR